MQTKRSFGAGLIAAALTLPATGTLAQTARDLVGHWTLVSSFAQQGGNRVDTYGPNPSGRLTFDAQGRYALIYVTQIPNFVSNNRATGTAEENRAVVQGSVAHYGSYSVDEASKMLVLRIETSTFPNWNGTEQRRPFTISGNELTYTSPGPLGPTTITLRRAQ